MTISLIAAIAENGAIGRDGDMLYHIGADLRRFREITMGHPIVMGRRTYESLPGGALPGRRNIVVTRSKDFSAPDVEVAHSIDEALAMCRPDDSVMIIGGGQIYSQTIDQADRLLLTIVHDAPEGADTYFPSFIHPSIPDSPWRLDIEEARQIDPRSSLAHHFICLSRK